MKRELVPRPDIELTDEVLKVLLDKSITQSQAAKLLGLTVNQVSALRRGLVKIRSEKQRECHKEYDRQYHQKYSPKERVPPKEWTAKEEEIIMTSDLPDRELSKTLNRTIKSIRNHRWILRKSQGTSYIETHPLVTLVSDENKVVAGENPRNFHSHKEYIINNYEKRTVQEIADDLSLSPLTVKAYLSRYNKQGLVDSKNQKYSKRYRYGKYSWSEAQQFIIEHYKDMTLKELGEYLGISFSTIAQRIASMKKSGLIENRDRRYNKTKEGVLSE